VHNYSASLASEARTPPIGLSFEQVFAEYAPMVWRTLHNLGVHDPDVQDASQETFVVVYRRLAAFRGDSSLKTWICGICLRVAAAYRRRAHRRHELPVAEAPTVEDPRNLEGEVELLRASHLLRRILANLDERKREVFVLYEIEQLTMAEIAETIGCPLRTAYSRLEAARREVRHAWERANPRVRVFTHPATRGAARSGPSAPFRIRP
jgi:RNA polymerase sigma-70 factor (ECF subfamily)